MQDKPLEKKSQSPLYQQLMARLKNDILAGVYPSGARIPSEQLLCETYGVSRVTVRKAMLDLVQEGLLVRRQGRAPLWRMSASSATCCKSPAFRRPAARTGTAPAPR